MCANWSMSLFFFFLERIGRVEIFNKQYHFFNYFMHQCLQIFPSFGLTKIFSASKTCTIPLEKIIFLIFLFKTLIVSTS